MNKVSIIIVNYNGKHHLRECLSSVLASDAASAEVILVDNGSVDNSCDYVRNEFPGVRVIPLDGNYGFAKANNIGVEAASGAYVAFLNNDTVVRPDWLRSLASPLSSDAAVGVTGSKLLFYHDPKRVNSAGATILFNGAGHDIGFGDFDGDRYDVPGPRGAVCGAAMMVRKRDFTSLGGFDEKYFLYLEDIDLCWRYWLAGFKVLYVPSSVVYHKFGGTSGSETHAPLRVFYTTRNSMLNVFKHYELKHMAIPVLFNLWYHAFKFMFFCGTLRFNRAQAVLQAYGSLFRLLPYIRKGRKAIQQRRTVGDSFLLEHGLISSSWKAGREYVRLIRTRMGRQGGPSNP